MRSALLFLGCAGGALGVGACGEPGPPRPRLVVLYATCTVNKDFLGPYAEDVSFTPNIDRFAAESIVFRRHETEAAQSGPAFASIFSGTQADVHGVYHHPTPLPDELYTVGEAFADAGYETHFWSGHKMGSADLNYGQGVPPERTYVRGPPDRDLLSGNDEQFARLLDRLEADHDLHAFVQINFTLTHGPYHAYSPAELTNEFCERHPEECAGVRPEDVRRLVPLFARHRLQLQWNFPETAERLGLDADDVTALARTQEMLYSSCVAQLDRYFGKWVAQVREHGLWDESVIAFTADHGEVLYRENALFQWTHGGQLAPEGLGVPWILRSPLGAGTYEGITRSIDVYPTLAGLAGVELPAHAGVQGVDLSPALRGERSAPELVALSRTTTLMPTLVEQARDWTLFHSFFPRSDVELIWVRAREGDLVHKWRDLGGGEWGLQVFDLARDPDETTDLFDPQSAEHAAMREALVRYKERLVAGFERRARGGALSDEEADAKMRALGYIEDR